MSAALRNQLVADFDKFYKARTWSGGVQSIQVRLALKTVQSIVFNAVCDAVNAFGGASSPKEAVHYKKTSDKIAEKLWNDWYKTNVTKRKTNSGSKNWEVESAGLIGAAIVINCKLTTAGIKNGFNIERVHNTLRLDFAKFIESGANLKTWKWLVEFEHGSLGESDFAKPMGPGDQLKLFDPNAQTRKDIVGMDPRSQKTKDMVQAQFAKNTGEGMAKAPGARGTIVSKSIVVAASMMKSSNKNLMTKMEQLMKGVLTDYFNWDHSVLQQRSLTQVKDEFKIRGSIEWTGGDPSNSGAFDGGIAALFRETLSGPKATDEFVRIAQKYVKHIGQKNPKRAQNLWADSPGPVDAIEAIGKRAVVDSLFPHKTKANMRFRVNRKLYNEAKKHLGKKKSPVASTKKKKIKTTSIRTAVGSTAAGKKIKMSPAARSQGRTQMSPIALRNILNEMLPEMVASKMTQPALQFRTGRFANSARVENVNMGPRGGVGIDYTYMRNPYETFEPGNKQGSTHRDPRRIIGGSIRELATGILGRQPTSIRRT